ncbi:hypothetical protein CK934_01065 [Chitinophaga sp. MD30]|nr:hypothetical protein CK934_01065 [Chitinophaga sp. MD30]
MLLVITVSARSQKAQTPELPKILPPTPNAAELVKDTRITTGLFTGTAQFDIPLYTIRYRNVNVPIGLSYSSNGVKVDQIASRVGVDWVLNAGGVITRTVMHKDDLTSTRRPNPVNNSREELAKYVEPFVQQDDIYDTQSDEFSYNVNGLSGKFFLDDNKTVQQISIANVKIERATLSQRSSWDFRIVDGDGITYWFGGDQARESSKTTGSCGYEYTSYVDVAWYLNKITYPGGDEVILNYDPLTLSNYATSISESYVFMYPGQGDYQWNGSGGNTQCEQTPIVPNMQSLCVQYVTSRGVVLKSIVAGKTQLLFGSTDREDLEDKCINTIKVFYNGSLKKDYELQYTYALNNGFTGNVQNIPVPYGYKRLFLTGILEKNIVGSGAPLSYRFEYYNMNNLPPRLSCAQDYGGYFHGRADGYYSPAVVQKDNDASLIEISASEKDYNLFNGYGNNKEPDTVAAKMGVLRTITYPTGGKEEIVWEGNTVRKKVTVYPSEQTTSATVSGEGLKGAKSITKNFTISYPQTVRFRQRANILSPDEYDPIHNMAEVELTAPSGTVISSQLLGRNLPAVEKYMSLSEIGTYTIKVTAYGAAMGGLGSVTARVGNISQIDSNVIIPGLRVKQLRATAIPNTAPEVKEFYYAKSSELAISSGEAEQVRFYQPNYSVTKYMTCKNVLGGGGLEGRQQSFLFGKLSSYSLMPMYISGQALVNYKHVTIGYGEKAKNGLQEHEFKIVRNKPGNWLNGSVIYNAPYANNGFLNGLETAVRQYRNDNNSFKLVGERQNIYSSDARVFSWFDNYVLQRKAVNFLSYGPQVELKNLDLFDIVAYPRYKYWIHLDTVYEKIYDQQGTGVLTNTTIYSYNNLDNLKVTEQQTFASNGSVIRQRNKYITDFLSENVYQQMNTLHMNNAVIEQLTSNGSNFEIQRDQYLINPRNATLPVLGSKAYGQNTTNPEKRIEYQQYDALGNIQQQSKSGDASEIYLWGYDRQYPVAKILGSDYNTVIALVNDNILQQPPSDQTLRNELAKIRTALANTQAMVSTYTYLPLVGMTSETTPDGRTRYYEYDAFGRLSLIKDHNGKILKQIDYQYQVPVQQ